MKNIGVIGSGTMGSGIAQACAQNSYRVKLYDIESNQLRKAIEQIKTGLEKRVTKGKMAQEFCDITLDNISTTADFGDLSGCDLVIEAIYENLEAKQDIFKKLEKVCSKDTILATNTSSLPIIEIAKELNDPSRVVGIHFFNPAHIMKLVEIVRSIVVSKEAVEKAEEFAKSLGKEVIFAKDVPGFILNYLQYPFRLHAIRMVENGMATVEDIDKAAKLGLGHPMGPLELQDLVGLDITYNAVSSIYEETKDPLMAPPVLMRRMVEAGYLGRKTGKGFYEYNK